jgi:Protein of unknown function (DUF3485)
MSSMQIASGATLPTSPWVKRPSKFLRDAVFTRPQLNQSLILTGQSPDGLLFRISSIDRDPERAFAMQQKFVADMMALVPPEARRKLSGLTS